MFILMFAFPFERNIFKYWPGAVSEKLLRLEQFINLAFWGSLSFNQGKFLSRFSSIESQPDPLRINQRRNIDPYIAYSAEGTNVRQQ